jgi:acyl-CoA synthetase (AMP-forming)/AMP-acid ligase II
LIERFDQGAHRNPDGAAFTSPTGDEVLTYRETADLTHRIAAALHRDGVGSEAPVAVLSPNSVMMFPYVLGIMRAGCAWVQLNARSAVPELADLLRLIECRAIFVAPELRDTAEVLRAEVASLEHVIVLGDVTAEDWLAPTGSRVRLPPLDREAIASYNGTGGTTGRSKAVALSHRALETMVLGFHAHMPEDHPVHLVAAPLTHAAGCVVFPVLGVGGVNVVHKGVDAAEMLASIERHRVTQLYLPPTAIYTLLAHPDVRRVDTSSLRYFLYAAAPMSVSKLREAVDVFGPVMTQCYGQAEAPMLCTFFGPEEHAAALAPGGAPERLASCGRASLVANVAVMSDEDEVVPAGVAGEIVVRSSLTMNGYHANVEQTAAVSRGDGWHATGDIGYIDADGYVYIVDRKRDMIISGGFNVFPSEVEQVVWSHPAVNDCAVIGLPHEKWGEQVTAVVELKEDHVADPAELIALCKEQLGSVKAPKEIIFRQLPRSPVGKVLKRTLRDEYWVGQTRRV